MDRLLILANRDRALNPGNVLHPLPSFSHTNTGLAGFLLHARRDGVQLLQVRD